MYKGVLVSIDIGTFNIILTVGKATKRGVRVKQIYSVPTPENAIDDGDITNEQELYAALFPKIKEFKLKNKKAVITVHSSSIINREFILPRVKGNNIETMLQFEIEQYMPIILHDYVIQHKVLEIFSDESGKKQRVLLSAIPTSLVERYYKLIKSLSLNPFAMDTYSNSLEKIFFTGTPIKKINMKDNKTIACVDFGHQTISVNILKNGMFRYERIIPAGGKNITDTLEFTHNISREEALLLKHNNVSISDTDAPESIRDVSELAKTIIDDWFLEIQRNFNFYKSRTPGNIIDEVYIYGGSSVMKGLTEYMEEFFSLPVKLMDKMDNIKLKKMSKSYYAQILNAAGAMIRK